jgi:subtilisin family serine protease
VRRTHEDFGGRVTFAGDFCSGARRRGTTEVDAEAGYDGHDTHVASYAAGARSGLAKRARIVALRTTWYASATDTRDGGRFCRGDDNDGAVAAAFRWIAAHAARPAVTNYSGGHGDSEVQSAILAALDAGVSVTLSGDTGGSVAAHWGDAVPARALVVGGTDRDDRALAPSAYDPSPPGLLAIFAPAKGLFGAGMASDRDFSIAEACGPPCAAGDSFAAPLVAGAAALYLERHRAAPPCEVRQAILDSGRPVVTFRAADERAANRLLHVPIALTSAACR